MPTDQQSQFVFSIAALVIGTGLQMVGAKRLGVVVTLCGVGWMLWLLIPTDTLHRSLWISGGWIAIALVGLVWITKLTRSVHAPTPRVQVSSTNQSVGVAGNYNTILYNQTSNARSEATREISDTVVSYFREGQGMLKNYESAVDVTNTEAKRWSQKVARYLDSNLGSTYKVHFEDNDDEPKHESEIRESILALKGSSKKNREVHRYLSARLSKLRDIMEELRGKREN